ncbi:MAG TPA: AsnC family protein, partial [Pseudomonas sp.]|nr:AsnC family protein [Pseudomonas sp.]
MSGLDDLQAMRLRRLLEEGLPLEPGPYRVLAERIGADEEQVLAQVQKWQAEGLFRRVGLVLKHRALGIRANA